MGYKKWLSLLYFMCETDFKMRNNNDQLYYNKFFYKLNESRHNIAYIHMYNIIKRYYITYFTKPKY